jgi:hypothetical protein
MSLSNPGQEKPAEASPESPGAGNGYPDVIPALVLGLVVLVILGGWLSFPLLSHFLQKQDCIAAGYMQC